MTGQKTFNIFNQGGFSLGNLECLLTQQYIWCNEELQKTSQILVMSFFSHLVNLPKGIHTLTSTAFPKEFKLTYLESHSSLCFFHLPLFPPPSLQCYTLFSSLVLSNYLCGATGLLR